MKISYAHELTKRGPRDISNTLLDVAPELEEIGGWSKSDLQASLARFARWYLNDQKAGDDVKIEVFRGESLSMVTASLDGVAIGWRS